MRARVTPERYLKQLLTITDSVKVRLKLQKLHAR